jgi:predicted DNA-binding mobile mystery protein A
MKAKNASARTHLDARLVAVRQVASQGAPHRGWLRAIREALGMSTTELAARMGVTQSRISALERGEVEGTIKLETLRRAAAALDCDLMYALVPRTPLSEAVRRQARRKAAAHLRTIRHHMRLEDQEVAGSNVDDLQDAVDRLIDRRGLWADTPTAG